MKTQTINPRQKPAKAKKSGPIQTISAEEYCQSIGKQLSDYRIINITTEGESGLLEKMISEAPANAEAIVNCKITGNGTQYSAKATGTALIPKEDLTWNQKY